ncbi:hypothetical protein BLL42_11440 [Pseudomonas frederiksbergensis]|uniref:Uncharacterized protein n=2 Tax=Pseudomonas frederiksbergensis TaxID=104087 RepID=A0A1J0EK13_9PSED|nr:hypothetical protein BLL42_11440 [Pseudomonas frederiksbergensis]
MTDETPAARKTRLARERKRAERKRLKDKRLAMGASKLKMEIYSGTERELEQIRTAGAFDETEHALTATIHGVAELSRRDPAAFRALIQRRGQ